jgi:hypothetical protein
MWPQEDPAHSESEHVSDMILAVLYDNYFRDVNSDVYKVSYSAYNKSRWNFFN